MVTDLGEDGVFDTDDGFETDSEIGEEIYQEQKTLNDLYLEIKTILN